MGESKALSGLRKRIDAIDDELCGLLNKRARVALEISKLKKSRSFDIYDPSRETEIEARIARTNEGPMPTESMLAIFREIISGSRSLQKQLEVVFLGPEGSYSHQAAFGEFGGSASLVPTKTIEDVFSRLQKGSAALGVVPVENSTEGSVGVVLDMLLETRLAVLSEVYLRISHCLLTSTGGLEGVESVASHPQALGQCRRWLEEHVKGCVLHETHSTASAAVMASEDPSVAAIAGEMAAGIYGLHIVERNIEDVPGNTTRFWVIGTSGAPAPTGNDKTSIVFSLKHEPGALNAVLASFGAAGLNLTKIESRPTRERPWEYVFFVDFLGHATAETVSPVLKEIEGSCIFLRILGSYPLGLADRD